MTNKPLTLGLVATALLMANSELKAALTAQTSLGEPTASSAEVVFSNLGPGNTYGTGPAFAVSTGQNLAASLTPSGNFTLTQIDVAITYPTNAQPNQTNSVRLSVEGSSADGLPNGTPLESFTLTGLPTSNLGECPATPVGPCVIEPSQIVNVTKPVRLLEGTEYWVVARNNGNSSNGWNNNLRGETGFAATNPALNIWSHVPSGFLHDTPGFAVFGTPVGAGVPEPATLGLLVLGLLGGARFAGRKRRN